MTRRAIPLVFGLALIAGTAAPASAHDTYLLPPKFISASPVGLDLTSAGGFPAIEYGPKKARIAKAKADGPDAAAKIKIVKETKTALKLSLVAKKPGNYIATVELSPHDIDLTPDQVKEYFAEIEPPPELLAVYAAMPEPRTWKETYSKYAKAMVCVASCGSPAILAEPSGVKLEFVAVAESLTAGKPRFRLLDAGTPRANAAVAIFRSGDASRMVQRTDAKGEFDLPAGLTGPVLLAAVLVAPPKEGGGRFTSDFATLTFDAGALAQR